MKQQVLGFLFNAKLNRVVLIRKNKPTYLAGQLNGVGGKVEEDEEPAVAMCREFREETGIATIPLWWTEYLRFRWKEHEVICYYCVNHRELSDVPIRTMTDEPVGVYPVYQLDPKEPPRRTNLSCLMQMAIDHHLHGRPE